MIGGSESNDDDSAVHKCAKDASSVAIEALHGIAAQRIKMQVFGP